MNVRLCLVAVCLAASLSPVHASDREIANLWLCTHPRQGQPNADTKNAFHPPKVELKGKLAKIFKVNHCEYVSGLSCRIHYNGNLGLPSEVFFTEFDNSGKKAGAPVRLIYPKLKPGETAIATFRIRLARPVRIVLLGEWKGPWRDPY